MSTGYADRVHERRPSRPRRRDLGRIFARVLCFLLATLALLPVALAMGLRSTAVRKWAAAKVEEVARAQKVVGTFSIEVSLVPLAFVLRDVRIESSDGGPPALLAQRLVVRPKLFGLLAGKVAIDQVSIERPTVRVVLEKGELKNLAIKLPESDKTASGPFHAPFKAIAITEGAFDVRIDETTLRGKGLDLDLEAQDDVRAGSSFETKLWVSSGTVERERTSAAGERAFDEDRLCDLKGTLRIDPDAITVHRLALAASVDLDPAKGTMPACGLPEDDRRRVDASLSQLRVRLPKDTEALPQISGHVKARAPIGLGERFVSMPPNDGWVGVDVEMRFVDGMRLPELDGSIRGAGLQITHYRFAEKLEGQLRTRGDVVMAPRLAVVVGDANVTLSDVEVQPFVKGIPLKTGLEIKGLNFTSLMRDLGVHPHSHVAWDIQEGKVATMAGTIIPLRLDGDLAAKTEGFAVYDAPADSPKSKVKSRLIGVPQALLNAHVAIRHDGVQFQRLKVTTPKSLIEGGLVSLGYNEILRVELPAAKLDLGELSPLGNVTISGQADAQVEVTGAFGDPRIEADATIQAFSIGDIPFGNITAAHVRFRDLVVGLTNVKATKGKSHYEMPTATIDFGGAAGLAMDGVVTSPSFDFRDFLALWHMEDDPRFQEIEGSLATRSNVHIALGGPRDPCGGGFVDIDAHAKLKDVTFFGERFDDGEVDLDYEWRDRLAGLYGADIQVHSFSLRKLRPSSRAPGTPGPQGGTILGSAAVTKGRISGNVVIQGVPLSTVQTLGPLGQKLEATAAGFARLSGTVDEYTIDGDLDVSPTLLRGTRFGPSRLHFKMQEAPTTKAKVVGKSGCGAPILEAFDKDAYLRDKSVHGETRINGELFGGQVKINDASMTREDDPAFKADIELKKLDLGSVTRLATTTGTEGDEATEGAPTEGTLSGGLVLSGLRKSDYSKARIDFSPTELSVTQGGQRLSLKSTDVRLSVKDDAMTVPPLAFELRAENGLAGTVRLSGTAKKITRGAELDLAAQLDPIDLGVLAGTIPRIQKAQGQLAGVVRVKGRAVSPDVQGRVAITNGDFVVQGLPSAITAVNVEVEADSNEIRIARGNARFAGGTLGLTGRLPLRGMGFGAGEVGVAARGVRFAPDDGIKLTADADLVLELSPPTNARGGRGKLPHVAGDVLITSFEYSRPMALTGSLGDPKARRASVESYDPTLDSVTLDINVRARTPLRIRNNMVDVQLGIESDALQVVGTNQRIGLRGELKSQPGGRFHFRSSEFEVRQALLRFDDPTRIAPNIDVVAMTEYRRMGDSANVSGAGRQAGLWRITLHAYGEVDNLKLDMTSDPPLSQEDIVLLLTVGMTRTELDQLQAGALGAGAALEAIAAASGADSAVKKAVPVIDDFRFGSAYSSRTGRTEPQVTLGKRITENVRASVTTSLAEDRELRSNIEWRLSRDWSLRGTYDNINDAASSTVGNLGAEVRWRFEFR